MSRRVFIANGGHPHRTWEAQPLLRSTSPRRRNPVGLILIAFVLGILLGLCMA